jgi:hypothetical protein
MTENHAMCEKIEVILTLQNEVSGTVYEVISDFCKRFQCVKKPELNHRK